MTRKHTFSGAAALAILLAFSPSGYAGDNENSLDSATVPADTTAAHRAMAKKAAEDAARKAVESVRADNKLDLDIRLIGPTSVKIAGDR